MGVLFSGGVLLYAKSEVAASRSEVLEMEFGERLRTLRKSRGMSLRDLATRADVSTSYLSDLERGTRGAPTAPVLERLADALGVSVDTLLGRESLTPLLDEADVAFANKLREISLEDRLIIERILENAIARQQREREEEKRRKREGEESGAT